MTLPADQRGPYTTTSTYDPADRLKTVTDGLGHTTTFGYDRDGNQTSVTSPGAQSSPSAATVERQVTRVFDGRDLPWRETTDDGLGNAATSVRTTVTEYDANGNLRWTVKPQGVNANGQPAVADDGETLVTTSNNLNRYATVREYDPDGLVTRVSQPEGTGPGNDDHLFRTDFGYTGPGFLERVSLPYDVSLGETPKTTAYNHYDNGWIRSASDPQHIAEGASNDVIQTLTYGYDHRGNQTSWKRDAILQGSQQPAQPSRTIVREFAADGTLTRRQATKGGAGEREYAYAYDADRRLRSTTTTVDPNPDLQGDVETFAYDDADRLLRANDSRARNDTLLAYDADGNVTTRRTDGTLQSDGSYVGGKTTTFGYDVLGRQESMLVDPVVGGDRASSFAYYPSGERMRVVDPNGVAHVEYFDAVGQVTQKRRVKGSGVDVSQTYAYDADGNRTKDEKGALAYNSRDQLVSWTRTSGSSVSYVLNGAGAVLRSTDSQGPDVVNLVRGDRLDESVTTPVSGPAVTRKYKYDGFGNLVRIHREGDLASQDTTYVFDAFERLITSTDPSLAPTEPTTTSFGYDGLDRRDFQTTGGLTSTFGYVAATDDVSVERAPDHTVSFDYDAGGERLGMQVDVAGVGSYRPYITDAQGSVQALEMSTGAPEPGSEVGYTPYGEQDAVPSSTIGKRNPYRFQGFYYDPTARAYDALAREYRPDIQRFLTQDRFEAAGGDLALAQSSLTSDRYAFVAGNPTTLVEDDGHVTKREREAAKVAAGAVYRRGTVAYEHYLGNLLRLPDLALELAPSYRALARQDRADAAAFRRHLKDGVDRRRQYAIDAERHAIAHPSLLQRSKGPGEFAATAIAGVLTGGSAPVAARAVGGLAKRFGGSLVEKVGPGLQRFGRNVLERLGILKRTPKPASWGPLGRIETVGIDDPAARALAERIGGQASVRFSGDATGREFDAISDLYVAQSKPAGFKLGSQFRNQAKATFEVAQATGRTPYFHFEGPPARGVVKSSMSMAVATGIDPVIDAKPYG